MQLEENMAHKRKSDLGALFFFEYDLTGATLTAGITLDGTFYPISDVSIVDPADYEIEPVPAVADYTVVQTVLLGTESQDNWPVGETGEMEARATFDDGRIVRSSTLFVKIQGEVVI